MIIIRRIGHATFETPDVERQIDYYVNIFGLTLTEREKDRAFLSTRLGQQVVVLEQGQHARCTKLAFEAAPDVDLAAVHKSLGSNGIVASRKRSKSIPIWWMPFADKRGRPLELHREREPKARCR